MVTEEEFNRRFESIKDNNVKKSVEELFAFYDPEAIVRWWAGLWEPEIGGFYYANSARDYEGFLPDIESGQQISARMQMMTGVDLREFYGEKISEKLIHFYQTKQDEKTGYFFHPQFPADLTKLSTMRYNRDQDWSINMLRKLGSAPLYPTALDRMKNNSSAEVVSAVHGWNPHDGESAREFVRKALRERSDEGWSNFFQTQLTSLVADGVLEDVLDELDAQINPEYGLWVRGVNPENGKYVNLKDEPGEEVPYGIFTMTYKVIIMYNRANHPYPYPIEMMKNAVRAILSCDPGIRVTYIFNPWATLAGLRQNLVKTGRTKELAEYDAVIREFGAEMIHAICVSLGNYRHKDGSFSFLPGHSSPYIYNTPVSLGLPEGDVNATHLVLGFASHISNTLGLEKELPVFHEGHWRLFRELLNCATVKPKKPVPRELLEETKNHKI